MDNSPHAVLENNEVSSDIDDQPVQLTCSSFAVITIRIDPSDHLYVCCVCWNVPVLYLGLPRNKSEKANFMFLVISVHWEEILSQPP